MNALILRKSAAFMIVRATEGGRPYETEDRGEKTEDRFVGANCVRPCTDGFVRNGRTKFAPTEDVFAATGGEG
jgi:hypothetical protein